MEKKQTKYKLYTFSTALILLVYLGWSINFVAKKWLEMLCFLTERKAANEKYVNIRLQGRWFK